MRALVLVAALLGGCGYEGVFACDSDAQCRHGEVVGTCEATGGSDSTGSADPAKYCLFPDTTCTMGKRWDNAGFGYDKLCLGEKPGVPIDASPTVIDAAMDVAPIDAKDGP